MYKVSGKVVIKETGSGISDLQIVFYDIDNRPDKGSPNDPVEIFKSQGGTFVWQQIPGDRLGSTLTDDKGEFELIFDESDFLVREEVKRPDLLLLIMAPEDAVPI